MFFSLAAGLKLSGGTQKGCGYSNLFMYGGYIYFFVGMIYFLGCKYSIRYSCIRYSLFGIRFQRYSVFENEY